jgi:hypothetical protein
MGGLSCKSTASGKTKPGSKPDVYNYSVDRHTCEHVYYDGYYDDHYYYYEEEGVDRQKKENKQRINK